MGGAILLSFRFDLYPFDALAIHAFFPILGGIVAPVVCALVWGNGPVCDYGMYPNRKGFKWGIFLAFIFWWLHIGKILCLLFLLYLYFLFYFVLFFLPFLIPVSRVVERNIK